EILRDRAPHAGPAPVVTEPPCDALGRGNRFPPFPEIAQRLIRARESELRIDGLLEGVSRLWDLHRDTHRLIEDCRSFLAGRSTKGLFPRTPKISKRLLPRFALERMLREDLDRLAAPLFQRYEDSFVQQTASIAKHVGIGDLVRERVLERVL